MKTFKRLLTSIYAIAKRKYAIRRNIEFCNDLRVARGSFINASGGLKIGREVSIGANVWISCNGIIGNGVLISSQVGIVSRDEHDINHIGVPISKAHTIGDEFYVPNATRNRIEIGDDVWIGFNATILSGVTIGRGAIIAAAAVVTASIEPYAIVVGNPAKCIGYRMSEADRVTHEACLAERWRVGLDADHLARMSQSTAAAHAPDATLMEASAQRGQAFAAQFPAVVQAVARGKQ